MTLYHIDTDMGVDDGLALVFASWLLGDRLIAVSTVFGNVGVEIATQNARIFRRLLKLERPFSIFVGASSASDGFVRYAFEVHGDDGLGGATHTFGLDSSSPNRDAVRGIDSMPAIADNADKIVLIGLGPATNIPRLVEHYGAGNIERIVLMSGVFLDVGNITLCAEFNAYCDPHALRATLMLGVPVTMVPLDVCRKVQLSRQTVSSYRHHEPSELTRLIVESHMKYMDFYRESDGIDGCFPYDTIAVLAASEPDWFFRIGATVEVEVSHSVRGKTSLQFDSASHVSVVTGGTLKNVRDLLSVWPLST
jgi:inosine-uridine nucleoside N-ribohydrolase